MNGQELKNYTKAVRNHEKYCLIAVQSNYKAAEFISERLKQDVEFVKKIVKIRPGVLQYLDKKYLSDPEIIEFALYNRAHPGLEFLPKKYSEDFDSAIIAVQNCASNYDFVDGKLKRNMNILESAFSCDGGRTIQHLPEDLYEDENVMLLAVEVYGENMSKIPSKYLYDENFILKAIVSSPSSFPHIPSKFKDNPFFVQRLLKKNGMILEYLEEFDEDNIRIAIESDPMSLKFVPKKFLEENEKIVKFALIKNNQAIEVIPPKYMKDRKLALEIVEDKPNLFKYFSNRIKMDKEIILVASKKDKEILRFVPKIMEYDIEIIWIRKRYHRRIREVPLLNVHFLFQ